MAALISWVVLILGILAPILVAPEKTAQLSLVIFFCLLGVFSVRLVVSYRRRRKVQQWKLHARQEFPDAHILVVSYYEGLKDDVAESFDMRVISENLTNDLIQANIGQTPQCPVVLVGHSFGGLVIKELCLQAQKALISRSDTAKVHKFLNNLRGVFYYSTPHHGSPHVGRATKVLSGPLFNYFTILSTEAERLNYDFNRLLKSYPKWRMEGLGEMLPVKTGIFQGIVIVPEASARDGENFNLDTSADHFSVCRPEKKTSRRFNSLARFLRNICDNLKDEKAMAQKQAVRQNLQRLQEQTINMDVLVQEVKSRLKKFTTIGFVGMGGLGKTTLAKAVFNELSPSYEYSCFVPNLNVIEGDYVDEVKKVVWKHMHRFGKKVDGKDDISDLSGRHLLLVLDDIKDRDITLLSDLVHDCSPQSRFIVTTREANLLNCLDDIDIYQVPLLEQENAQQLFLSHAFPKGANFPASLERDMVAVVAQCGGLPLTLEVIGSYLKRNNDSNFWKQTLRALEKAEAIQDLDKRLWAKLRVSYNGLNEVEKQMFLDATTFFAATKEVWECLSLREAKAAWREAYGTECESLLWRTLVDRSLVYHVEENEGIRVHDQLLSLGQKISSESSKNGRCRIWEKKMASKLLKDDSEENQDIHALRFSRRWDYTCDDMSDDHTNELRPTEIHISGHTLCKLKNLHYLEVDAPLIIDGVEEATSFPSNLVLLKWAGNLETFNLGLQDHLVVLNLSYSCIPRSIGQLSALRIFIGEDITSVPDEFGNLSRLEYLELKNCNWLSSLPESFRKLSQLQYLKFTSCARLQFQPEVFCGLSNLKELEIKPCYCLRSLTEDFGDLSALNHLVLGHLELVALPNSFGNLSTLKHIEIIDCEELHTLPDSFGNLSALKHLEIIDCVRLHALPDSFGNLFSLNHLIISDSRELQGLPDSFGNLSALNHLTISDCRELQGLPDSFGNLSALNHLTISYCRELQGLPDSFGNLAALEELNLTGCDFEALPNSFEKLSTLRHLELKDCENFFSQIPFSKLTQLQYLKVHGRLPDRLIQMEKLPESLAELTALSHVSLQWVSLRRIPDFLKSMQSLRILELNLLPYIKELPAWLGETGAVSVALSRKMFQVQNGRFSLTSGEPEAVIRSKWLINKLHDIVMEKFWESDYEGALADLCQFNLGVLRPELESFLLRERGIARRFTGDLKGALEDVTAAVKVLSDANDLLEVYGYASFKHRGYIKYLLGDEAGARRDAERCMAMKPDISPESLGGLPVAFLEFKLKGTILNEYKLSISPHKAVMEKVKGKDFLGALAIWDDFNSMVFGYQSQTFFLQERGILKQMAGNLHGALEDLTAALEIDHYDYQCLKHRGYVKFLLGDIEGACTDAERCLAMGLKEPGHDCLGVFPVSFQEFEL